MNDPADNERLLTDVLADEAGFRETLFSETLRLARRRRRMRQARRTAAAVVVLAGLAALVWQSLPPRGTVPQTTGKLYIVVHTRPLPEAALVTTRPFSADRLVASVATTSIVTTPAASGQFREIGDDELLALAAPRPVVLIRLGPHLEELVFVNSEDQKGFPLN
jgi:hypothetical protein